AERDAEIAERDAEIAERDAEIAERDAQLERLRAERNTEAQLRVHAEAENASLRATLDAARARGVSRDEM
ncbi:MAG TPA: hypothetical protein VKD22_18025, partial [Ramlibacter sp.]|nr:hypothetical protein [Ramlibacter sp.]